MRAEPWHILKGDEAQELPTTLPQWDYNTNLVVRRNILVDVIGLKEDAKLQNGHDLALGAVWSSSGTNLRECLAQVDLDANADVQTLALFGEIPGKELAGDVRIATILIVRATPAKPIALTPSIPGSVLWGDALSVALEGNASRFPVEVVDFSAASWTPNPEAGWFVSWNRHDLHQPMMGSVRLFLNSRR